MVTFIILLILLLALLIVAAIAFIVGGASFIVMFGDLIVFMLIAWALVKMIKFIRRRK